MQDKALVNKLLTVNKTQIKVLSKIAEGILIQI